MRRLYGDEKEGPDMILVFRVVKKYIAAKKNGCETYVSHPCCINGMSGILPALQPLPAVRIFSA